MPALIPTVLTLIALAASLLVAVASQTRSRRLLRSFLSPVLVIAAGMQTAVTFVWVLAGIVWICSGQLLPGALMLVAAAGFALLGRVPAPTPALATRPELTVMTVNVLNINADRGYGIAAEIRDVHPHVILFQEYSDNTSAGLAGLHDLYPHRLISDYPVIDGTQDLAIYSRIPLRNPRHVHTGDSRPVLLADLTWDGETVTVAAVHTLSPTDRHRAAGWVDEFAGLPAVLPSEVPLLVGGDFNAVAGHAPFRGMLDAAGLTDLTAGTRTWPNYRGVIPFWQLDHILGSRHWHVIGAARTGTGKGSDHRPLILVAALQ